MTNVNEAWLAAPAKVNLFLEILGKRDDGYHLIDSVIGFLDISDHIRIVPSGDMSLTIEGPFAHAVPAGDDNLVMRAASVLRRWGAGDRTETKGAAITLIKNIPAGAGLGGASADAAAVMRALCRLWEIDIGEATLQNEALRLGADVPACLIARPVHVRGIGEVLEPLTDCPGLDLVMVYPHIAVPTGAVYHAFDGLPAKARKAALSEDLSSFTFRQVMAGRRNDLEAAAIGIAPEIKAVLAALKATETCQIARMSGSGSACFGVFPNREQAMRAADALGAAFPQWWVKHARMKGSGEAA